MQSLFKKKKIAWHQTSQGQHTKQSNSEKQHFKEIQGKNLQAKYFRNSQLPLKCQGNRKTLLNAYESTEFFTYEPFLVWMSFIQLGQNLKNSGKRIND